MTKEELGIELDKVMFNEKVRMTREEIIIFLLNKYWEHPVLTAIEPIEQFNLPLPIEEPIEPIEPIELPTEVYALYKIDPIKESWKGTGTYIRHYFRHTITKQEYILDVTPLTKACYKGLKPGTSAALNPTTFFHKGKNYINGKINANVIHNWKPTPAPKKVAKKTMLDLL